MCFYVLFSTHKNMKLKLLIVALFCSVLGWGQIYQHDFGTTTISAHPYTVVPTTFDANLNTSSWINSAGAWTSFAGSAGEALSMNNSGGTPTITLTFNVASGFEMSVSAFNFWRQRSTTGAQSWSMTVNGIAVGSGTVPTAGAAIGDTNVSNAVNNLTGTITVVISLSGATGGGTFRLDDFTLNGTVTSTAPPTIVPTITSSIANLTATYGVAFTNYTITASESPTSFSATGLPAGVAINTTTGVISGTATVVGTFPVSISATNIIGTSAVVTKNYIVTPKPLTITGLTSTNKVYDGTTTATLAGTAVLSGGIISPDVVVLSGTPVSNYVSANVGTNYVITTTGYTLSGADALKYSVSQPSVPNRNVTQKPLTISGITANNKVYDANTTATLSGTAALLGIVGTDVVTLSGTPTANFANATVGTGKVVTVSGFTITGAQAINYSVSQPTGFTANITPAIQTLTFGPLPDRMLSATTFTLNATSTSGNPISYSSSNTAVATVSGNVVTMLTIGSTTFTASQAGSTNFSAAADVAQNQNIITGLPEINIEGDIGTFPDISSGDITPSGLDNTLFAAQPIGGSQTKGFRIRNVGGNTLNVSTITLLGANPGDFSITAAAPYAIGPPSGLVNFTITFSPTASGVRNAIVSIASNDSDENPYTFTIQGTGNCLTTTVTATPASGPVASQVTITSTNAVTNNLTGATASFGGVAATVLSTSSSQMVVIIPSGAVGNTLTTTNVLGCTATLSYVVTQENNTSCEGTGGNFTDLIISEVYDSNGLNVWHMELYNPTASPIDLSAAVYKLERYGDIGDATPTRTVSLTGIVAAGGVFLAELGESGVSCTSTFSFVENGAGINANDQIKLTKNNILVDIVNCPNNTGYTIRRNLTATGPRTTFAAGDWSTSSTESCADLNLFPYLPKNAPVVTTQPVAALVCTTTGLTLTVAATEGFVGGNPLAYQWFVAAPGSAVWTAVVDGGIYSGATTASLSIAAFAGVINNQYYCQIRENTATCFTASNAVIIEDTITTTWDGTTWSNGIPDLTKLAIINGTYNTTTHGNIDACSIIVNLGFTATITSGGYFNIQNDVTVNGTLDVLNNASLVQVNDLAVNTGNISYQRNTAGAPLDYVYWSSPVNTTNTPSGNIYTWDSDIPNPNGGQGNWIASGNVPMQAGVGYIMRDVFLRNFIGVPRNGMYTPTITRGNDTGAGSVGPNGVLRLDTDDNWNLLGNPYPSAISIGSFLTANTEIDGFVRLWTHNTSPSTAIVDPFYDNFVANYTASDYIAINGSGATSGSGTLSVIGGGQGFFVLMNPGGAATSTALFNNSMRNKGFSNSQFYRNTNTTNFFNENIERHRIWIDLVSPVEITRTLVAYAEGATMQKDRLFDAITDYKSAQNFYSLIDAEIMTIQGRSLPFDVNDQVPMGFKAAVTGNFTIAIAEVDGLFSANQTIYLEDKSNGIIHNLKVNPYNFTATAGIYNSRFVLRYTNETLGNTDFIGDASAVFVASNNGLTVTSTQENIKEIEVFDVLGRKLYQDKNIDSQSHLINSIQKTNSGLILSITLTNGKKVTKKTIY